MKLHLAFRCFAPVFALVAPALLAAAEPAPSPAGYWAGSITVPNQELAIAVELTSTGASTWQAAIDIPMQGMRGFKLSDVKVTDTTVEFKMEGIPGDPSFNGNRAADGKSISGTFSQSGIQFPFRLERAVKPAPQAVEATPAQGVPGKGLIGKWRGSISPRPGMELRLALELAAGASGKPEGVLVSLDQGGARIPVSALVEESDKVQFETPSVMGKFTGTMSADGSEITGEWSQREMKTPLVFKRLPAQAAQ